MDASLSLTAATTTTQTKGDTTGVTETGDAPITFGNEAGTTVTGAPEAKTEKKPALPKLPPPPDLGLVDGPEWKNWDGPKRLRESILSAEEKQKCQEILAQIFHPDTIEGVKILFNPADVVFVMKKVREYLKEEPMLIEDVPYPVQIVGDLHGQLYDLDRIFEMDLKDGKPGWEHSKYVFLGDYVDRGRQSIEVVMALFCIKMLYPDNMFLLRGNHEFSMANVKYGFYEEFMERYEYDTADALFIITNNTFNWLSIAAIVGDAYFCAHGGISPSAFTRRTFRTLNKPFKNSKEHVVIHDTVWSDPAVGLRGSAFNGERGSSVFFGLDALCHALTSMQVDMLVRAHTKVAEGFEINWWTCVTIYSATDSDEAMNKGATAIINEEGKIGFRVFEVDTVRAEQLRILKPLERPWLIKDNVIEDDDKTVVEREVDDGIGIKHY